MVPHRLALCGALVAVPLAPLRAQKPPADLGLPVYPGPRFEPQMSAEMSRGQQKFYVYVSGDAVA
ncbi:MAG TPA: hypothetical protein VF864_09365 [Gemmatimonadales bacterium]